LVYNIKEEKCKRFLELMNDSSTAYYQRSFAGKNIIDILKRGYNFSLKHGITAFEVGLNNKEYTCYLSNSILRVRNCKDKPFTKTDVIIPSNNLVDKYLLK